MVATRLGYIPYARRAFGVKRKGSNNYCTRCTASRASIQDEPKEGGGGGTVVV